MGKGFIIPCPLKIKTMEKNIFHGDEPILYLTVSQIKAIIEDALVRASSYLNKKDNDEVLTIEDVSKLTGYKKSTIYKLTHERKIPFHKPAHGGRKIFFKREEIERWLASNRIKFPNGIFIDCINNCNIKNDNYENKKRRIRILPFIL